MLPSFGVGVTGLEPATAWSQTRNATNCATPRCNFESSSRAVFLKCDAKVRTFSETCKPFRIFFHVFVEKSAKQGKYTFMEAISNLGKGSEIQSTLTKDK